MSPTLDEGGAAARDRAREITDPRVTNHARERWILRAQSHPDDVRSAWREAEPVHYPADSEAAVRYHDRTDLVLIAATDGAILTCIALAGRPTEERRYVRNQVSDL